MSIKSAVKEWLSERWKNWVRDPIADATVKYENQASEQINKYSSQVKAQIRKPGDYYWNQDAFYRGLFWMAIGLLVVLWIISGS